MARFIGGGSSGPDYVQPDEPTGPESPERWYDTDADPDGDGNAEGAMKVYGTDGTWHTVTIDDHGELGGVLEDNHHSYPIPTGGIVDQAVTAAKVAFGYVTPSEFNSHVSDESNPHNVTDSQTGAADALAAHNNSDTAHKSSSTFSDSGSQTVVDGSSWVTVYTINIGTRPGASILAVDGDISADGGGKARMQILNASGSAVGGFSGSANGTVSGSASTIVPVDQSMSLRVQAQSGDLEGNKAPTVTSASATVIER